MPRTMVSLEQLRGLPRQPQKFAGRDVPEVEGEGEHDEGAGYSQSYDDFPSQAYPPQELPTEAETDSSDDYSDYEEYYQLTDDDSTSEILQGDDFSSQAYPPQELPTETETDLSYDDDNGEEESEDDDYGGDDSIPEDDDYGGDDSIPEDEEEGEDEEEESSEHHSSKDASREPKDKAENPEDKQAKTSGSSSKLSPKKIPIRTAVDKLFEDYREIMDHFESADGNIQDLMMLFEEYGSDLNELESAQEKLKEDEEKSGRLGTALQTKLVSTIFPKKNHAMLIANMQEKISESTIKGLTSFQLKFAENHYELRDEIMRKLEIFSEKERKRELSIDYIKEINELKKQIGSNEELKKYYSELGQLESKAYLEQLGQFVFEKKDKVEEGENFYLKNFDNLTKHLVKVSFKAPFVNEKVNPLLKKTPEKIENYKKKVIDELLPQQYEELYYFCEKHFDTSKWEKTWEENKKPEDKVSALFNNILIRSVVEEQPIIKQKKESDTENREKKDNETEDDDDKDDEEESDIVMRSVVEEQPIKQRGESDTENREKEENATEDGDDEAKIKKKKYGSEKDSLYSDTKKIVRFKILDIPSESKLLEKVDKKRLKELEKNTEPPSDEEKLEVIKAVEEIYKSLYFFKFLKAEKKGEKGENGQELGEDDYKIDTSELKKRARMQEKMKKG